jgi:hypothetical protein
VRALAIPDLLAAKQIAESVRQLDGLFALTITLQSA